MKKSNHFSANFLRSASFAALALTLGTSSLLAATGDELLMGALPASSMNKSTIASDTLLKAVSDAVAANKEQAPEIVAAAIAKTRSMVTQKAIVKTAIAALGDYKSLPKGLIPQIVYAAIKASPNCGTSDGKSGYSKDGYSKDGMGGCECAEQYTKSAIESLGADPSERLVEDIVTSAVQATDGKCADRVANAASQAAPQYASSIADAAARAGKGGMPDSEFGDGVVFSPTGRPVPAPFVFPPATNGGIVPPTTPVN
jgi:hypothetical protein